MCNRIIKLILSYYIIRLVAGDFKKEINSTKISQAHPMSSGAFIIWIIRTWHELNINIWVYVPLNEKTINEMCLSCWLTGDSSVSLQDRSRFYVLFWHANQLSYLQGWRDCKGLQGLPGLHGLRMMGLWLGDKLKSKTRLHALALWLSACGLFFVGVSSCSRQHCKLKCFKDSLSGIMVLQDMKHDRWMNDVL